MVKWRYDEFFDLLEMPCTGFFFFPNSVFMIIFFILFYFFLLSSLSSSFIFFFLLPSWSHPAKMVYLPQVCWTRNGSHFHNTSHSDSLVAPGPAGERLQAAEAGHWLLFGLWYPFHSGKNALTLHLWAGLSSPKLLLGTALASPPASAFCVGSTRSSTAVSLSWRKKVADVVEARLQSHTQIRSDQVRSFFGSPALWLHRELCQRVPMAGWPLLSAGTVSIMLVWFAPCCRPDVGRTCV